MDTMGTVADELGAIVREFQQDKTIHDRLALSQAQIEALEKRVVQLEEENAFLHKRVAELGGKPVSNPSTGKFLEYRGALFKPSPGGGYEPTVYCLKCQAPMSSAGAGAFDYYCKSCNQSVNFRGVDLPIVMRELVKS